MWRRRSNASKLNELLTYSRVLNQKVNLIMAILDDLEAQTAANTDVINSVEVLVQDLAAKLQAALDSGNPARVQAVIDALKAKDEELAAAVAANTPAAPPAEPTT